MDDYECNLQSLASLPPGLVAIRQLCQNLYPTQPNPLQSSSLIKFWLGGPDPLDYISMYLSPGNESDGIPEHWHYVTFGLSDLYGDGRVFPVREKHPCESVSGFGFELTFRLKRQPGELHAPIWPTELMQTLARYVHNSGSVFTPGDHVFWNKSLDGSDSRVEDILMVEDPQLNTVNTPHGRIFFIQLVGIFKSELEAVQHWNGKGVLELLRQCKAASGQFWVTNMNRCLSVFKMDLRNSDAVHDGIHKEGSDLSGVSCRVFWQSKNMPKRHRREMVDSHQIQEMLQTGLSIVNRAENGYLIGKTEVQTFRHVELFLDPEAASLIELAIFRRLRHGRHFTFRSVFSEHAVTFVGNDIEGALVNRESPFVAYENWLQVYLGDEEMKSLLENRISAGLCIFRWRNCQLTLKVTNDCIHFFSNTN